MQWANKLIFVLKLFCCDFFDYQEGFKSVCAKKAEVYTGHNTLIIERLLQKTKAADEDP